jgi:release factor glutamine methyltransferase
MTPAPQDHSVRGLLKAGIAQLREANVPSYTLAAELLLLSVAGRDRTWLYAHPEEIVPESSTDKYFALLDRRAAGEPTQHLTGKQEFWGLEFEVTPDVLIPRPETEHLIEVALDRLAVREVRAGRPPRLTGENLTLVDIGTGSGCIATALAKELPAATVYAADISPAALNIAKRNATRLGFADRVHFIESNLFGAFSQLVRPEPLSFDLVISNPPYVSRRDSHSLSVEVREHEPALALYGGEEGFEIYAALVSQAQRYIKPAGLLVLELGYDSLPAVRPLLDDSTWANVGVTHDLAGIPRVLSAERLPLTR